VLPTLRAMIASRQRPVDALSSLAELEGGAGVPSLLELTSDPGALREEAERALAMALRRHHGELDAASVAEGHQVLRRGGGSHGAPGWRRTLIRALALDSEVFDTLKRGLEAREARDRAAAAFGFELLGDPGHAALLARAAAKEREPEAFRRAASASLALDGRLPLPALLWAIDQP